MTYLIAYALSLQCDTPTAHVERPSMVVVCGDEKGNPTGINGWTADRIILETVAEQLAIVTYQLLDTFRR